MVLAGAAMAAYQPAFFTAVDVAGVAIGTVVAIGSAPLLAGLIGWIVDGETPLSLWWLATVLGVAGVSLTALAATTTDAPPSGIIFALGAGLAFAVYITASRRVVGLSDPLGGMAAVFSLAGVLSLPAFWWVDLGWLASSDGALMALHLGLVATAAAYVLFAGGLRSTPAATAATASLAEPFTAGLLGVLLLAERPGPAGWTGMALIVAGLAILATTRSAVRAGAVPIRTRGSP
jgi:DME family drug/metabolite transporter